MLTGITNSSVATLLAARASQAPGRIAPAIPVSRASPVLLPPRVERVSLSGGAAALRDVGGTVDQLSRASNTLAVASTALEKAGDLLEKVQSALGDSDLDDAATQLTVDAAVEQLDRAASAQFGGQSLFSGAVSVRVPGASIRLPTVSLQSLGADESGAGSIISIKTGGESDIVENGRGPAVTIIARATAQIDVAQSRIEQFKNAKVLPALSIVQDRLQDGSSGIVCISSPDLARTTALLARAQTVVHPEQAGGAGGAPGTSNVLSLVA